MIFKNIAKICKRHVTFLKNLRYTNKKYIFCFERNLKLYFGVLVIFLGEPQ